MKWMIVRQVDERSSDICSEIERKAQQEGGLKIPFTVQGRTFGTEVINNAMNTTGQYYTHLFHENCRSHLVPISKGSDIVTPHRELDNLDRMMLVDSALAHNAESQTDEEIEERGDESEVNRPAFVNYLANKFRIKTMQALNFIKRSVF